jgi:hypothetical protein
VTADPTVIAAGGAALSVALLVLMESLRREAAARIRVRPLDKRRRRGDDDAGEDGMGALNGDDS